jgi:hypothetical protein
MQNWHNPAWLLIEPAPTCGCVAIHLLAQYAKTEYRVFDEVGRCGTCPDGRHRVLAGTEGTALDEAVRLGAAAAALAGEMEAAGFEVAAAYARLAGEALEDRLPSDWGRSSGPPGEEAEFELDEHGRVWVVRDGLCEVLGRREGVVAEIRRFLHEIAPK